MAHLSASTQTHFWQGSRCELHGGRHEGKRSDSEVRQHLVVARCARPEGCRPSGLCRVPEVEWHHRGLFPAPADRWHLGYADRSEVVFYIWPEKWILVGVVATWWQGEYGDLHRGWAMVVHSNALQPWHCSSNI